MDIELGTLLAQEALRGGAQIWQNDYNHYVQSACQISQLFTIHFQGLP